MVKNRVHNIIYTHVVKEAYYTNHILLEIYQPKFFHRRRIKNSIQLSFVKYYSNSMIKIVPKLLWIDNCAFEKLCLGTVLEVSCKQHARWQFRTVTTQRSLIQKVLYEPKKYKLVGSRVIYFFYILLLFEFWRKVLTWGVMKKKMGKNHWHYFCIFRASYILWDVHIIFLYHVGWELRWFDL